MYVSIRVNAYQGEDFFLSISLSWFTFKRRKNYNVMKTDQVYLFLLNIHFTTNLGAFSSHKSLVVLFTHSVSGSSYLHQTPPWPMLLHTGPHPSFRSCRLFPRSSYRGCSDHTCPQTPLTTHYVAILMGHKDQAMQHYDRDWRGGGGLLLNFMCILLWAVNGGSVLLGGGMGKGEFIFFISNKLPYYLMGPFQPTHHLT